MPAKTAVPSVRRISAPAPWAITSGKTPRTNANEVMRIGRSRTRAASTAASSREAPSCWRSRANWTMRMAFLAARPTRTTKPPSPKPLTSLRPIKAQVGGHVLGLLVHGGQAAGRAHAGQRGPADRRRGEHIVARDLDRPSGVTDVGHRPERHHVAIGVADLELLDGVGVFAK